MYTQQSQHDKCPKTHHMINYRWPWFIPSSHMFPKFKPCCVCTGLQRGELAVPVLGNKNRSFLHSVQSTSYTPKSWCTEALHLNPNTILHSDSESCCQGIQDLFACNCLILPFLQAQREPQPTDRQPNLAYWGTVQGCNTVSFTQPSLVIYHHCLPLSLCPSCTSPHLLLEQTLSELLWLCSLKVNSAECLRCIAKEGSVDRGNLELRQEEWCVEWLQHTLDGLFVRINSPVWTSKQRKCLCFAGLDSGQWWRFTDFECLLCEVLRMAAQVGRTSGQLWKHDGLVF